MALVPYKNQPLTFTEQIASSTKESYAWLRDYLTAIKNGRWHPFTQVERKARAATRNQPWGPTGTELNILAELTRNPVDNSIIFAVVELRLGYPPEKWRNVYKALTVLEFLVKRGDEGCVRRAQDDFLMKLEDLGRFEYTAPDGKDLGINVRHRAQAILALLKDDRRLTAEREAFQRKNGSNKYQGYTRDQMQAGWTKNDDNSTDHNKECAENHLDSMGNSFIQNGTNVDNAVNSPEYRLRDPGSALRNAGETKGVSMQENARYLSALRKLLERPENSICADCKDNSAGSRPSWASINTGVFICMRCAGVHRGLGVHISKVRSCTLDTWLPGQVAFMAHTGNAAANSYWEARLEGDSKPSAANLAELDGFIRQKYINRDFADKDACWPPSEEFEDDSIRAILHEMISPNGKTRASKMVSVASPSSTQQSEGVDGDSSKAGQQQDEEVEQPAPAASTPLINLLDLDDYLSPHQGDTAAAAGQPAAAVDPFRDLEAVFSAVLQPSQQQQLSQVHPVDNTVHDPFAASVAWNMSRVVANSAAADSALHSTPPGNASAALIAAQPAYSSGGVGLPESRTAQQGMGTGPVARPQYNPPWASSPPPAHVLPSPRTDSQHHAAVPPHPSASLSAFEAGFEGLSLSRAAAQPPNLHAGQPSQSHSPHPIQTLQQAQCVVKTERSSMQQHYQFHSNLEAAQPQRTMQHTTFSPHVPLIASTSSWSAANMGQPSSSPFDYHRTPAMQSSAASPAEAKLQSLFFSGLDGFVSQAERVTAAKKPALATGPITPGAGNSQAGSMISMKALQQGQQQIAATTTMGVSVQTARAMHH